MTTATQNPVGVIDDHAPVIAYVWRVRISHQPIGSAKIFVWRFCFTLELDGQVIYESLRLFKNQIHAKNRAKALAKRKLKKILKGWNP